jgi:hypothetical protein
MYYINNMGVPVVWFIHKNKSEHDYINLFSTLKSATEHIMKPKMILADYETALQNAAGKVFSGVGVVGDFFHFKQANNQWLKKNGYAYLTEEAQPLLSELFYAKTYEDFQLKTQKFKSFWRNKCDPYLTYFENQWEHTVSPIIWARYVRSNNTPSGTNLLEAWHDRIKNLTNQKSMSVNHLLVFLLGEWEWYNNHLNVPHLRKDLDKERDETKRYREKNNVHSTVHIEEVTSQELLPAPQEVADTENTLAIQPILSNTLSTQSIATTTVNPRSMMCIKCNNYGSNKGCKNNLCQSCCGEDNRPCSVTTHRRSKVNNAPKWNTFANMVDEALQTGKTLWIRYTSGKRSGKIRAVKVKSWASNASRMKFNVEDLDPSLPANDRSRDYIISRIEQISWNDFT